ncbi:Protein of unknown function [Fodinibius roseus]|uniref:Inner membrane protein YgaP-like transmembrane domain-containing protein n=1 Tax=Fodinibius roseus TaxID=1194090 RepID=A0A1M4X9G9_9BACT|nr:DUF2892 domain-containing protein [Fodinibius roseus]SHE90041.1 Protein of unknown function [Fodinibius roseus]
MKTNVGRTDTIVRVILAVVIFFLGFYYQSWWGVVGLIPLITGIVGVCPLYALLGVSTCQAAPKKL